MNNFEKLLRCRRRFIVWRNPVCGRRPFLLSGEQPDHPFAIRLTHRNLPSEKFIVSATKHPINSLSLHCLVSLGPLNIGRIRMCRSISTIFTFVSTECADRMSSGGVIASLSLQVNRTKQKRFSIYVIYSTIVHMSILANPLIFSESHSIVRFNIESNVNGVCGQMSKYVR